MSYFALDRWKKCLTRCPDGKATKEQSGQKDGNMLYESKIGNYFWYWDTDVQPLLEAVGELVDMMPKKYQPNSQEIDAFFEVLQPAFQAKRNTFDPSLYQDRTYEGVKVSQWDTPIPLKEIQNILKYIYEQPFDPIWSPMDTRVREMIMQYKIDFSGLYPPAPWRGPN